MYSRTRSGPESALLDQSTRAIMAGRGEPVPGEPLNRPPVFASGFHANGTLPYARDGSPTSEAFEEAIGALEGGTATAFSSGMGAAAAIFESLPAGARVVLPRTAYAEARRLLSRREADGKLRLTYVELTDTEGVIAALPGAELVWLESLTNPLLDVAVIDRIAAAARLQRACVVVDATLATPVLQRPLDLGADVVLHSATKYIGGHSDLLLGVAVTRDQGRVENLRGARALLGAVPGTMEAFLGLRGLRTLPLRLERAQATALQLARRLERHPGIRRVRYPGLASDPSHRRANRLLDGYGALLAFEVEGGADRADAVCASVRVFTHATSLGGVESLVERRSRVPGEEHVPDAVLRASIGCEHPEDLWADLERALDVSSSARA